MIYVAQKQNKTNYTKKKKTRKIHKKQQINTHTQKQQQPKTKQANKNEDINNQTSFNYSGHCVQNHFKHKCYLKLLTPDSEP